MLHWRLRHRGGHRGRIAGVAEGGKSGGLGAGCRVSCGVNINNNNKLSTIDQFHEVVATRRRGGASELEPKFSFIRPKLSVCGIRCRVASPLKIGKVGGFFCIFWVKQPLNTQSRIQNQKRLAVGTPADQPLHALLLGHKNKLIIALRNCDNGIRE